MNKINARDFGIYVHYPFCTRKCEYCDFLSFKKEKDIAFRYEKALISEIKERENELQELSKQGRGISLFFGGGTPSLMSVESLLEIMTLLKPYLSQESEISIEVNPGTCNEKKLRIYQELGINRLSFGLQSTCDEELKLLGRIHNFETFKKQYKLAREVGFKNINIDLMMALPYQSLEKYLSNLSGVISFQPEHISAYSLIIEEETPFFEKYHLEDQKRQRGNEPRILPGEDEERAMYDEGRKFLMSAGYRAYEISNYAKPGYECIHNMGYWQLRPYIGFGLGAASYEATNHCRKTQVKDLEEYISDNRKPVIEKLSTVEEMEEHIFLPLRTYQGIDIVSFEEKFQVVFEEIFGKEIRCMLKEGYVEYKEQSVLRFTNKGMDIGDYLILKLIKCF